MQTYKLYLVRHGMTAGNETGQYIGQTDIPVTTNGIKELNDLRSSGIYPRCNLVFSSPLKRAVQTAEIIFPDSEIVTDPDFREIDFGAFEGRTPMELKDREDYTKWVKGELPAAPGGEATVDFAARLCMGVNRSLRTMMERGENEAAVVLHGGAIMTLLAVSALPRRKMKEWACGNGRGYVVRITPSLYMKSGILEVIGEIPQGGAHLINGDQQKLFR